MICLESYNELSKKKTGFNMYQSRHCAYITYSVKTWFVKILSGDFELSMFMKINENVLSFSHSVNYREIVCHYLV